MEGCFQQPVLRSGQRADTDRPLPRCKALCRHWDFEVCPRLRPLHPLFNRWKQGSYDANLIGRNHDDCEFSARKILLITKLLIRRNEYLKLGFRSTEQFAVFCASPPHILNRTDREMGQPRLHDMGN